MSRTALRNIAAALVLALIPGSARWELAPVENTMLHAWGFPRSLSDPPLEAERKASVAWETRTGPQRSVVDMACLVPDLPTFFAAIAAWDEGHYFPVLIEDVEFTLKFLRAFRPARIVRYPSKAEPIPDERVWNEAVRAVGRAWVGREDDEVEIPSPEVIPEWLGPTPPGIVVSSPTSPMLAGAVALAAGRYQPLLRWEPTKRYRDLLDEDEATQLVRDLEARIADRIPNEDLLGDDCDFVTLAGDWPYRYRTAAGPNALDDLIGRSGPSQRRQAYTGRLLGSPAESAYEAMCSLFLQPASALLFDTYDERAAIWSLYEMHTAARRLGSLFPVTLRTGPDRAGIAGWHQVFDPINLFGLVMINSSGSPTQFLLRDGWGQTADVPSTVPAVVLQIHSHSAADPSDPETLAGRWLANGAFVYVGAMNEPNLQGFRTPTLVSSLIAAGLPLGAAVRQSAAEPFGQPWRLLYLGDPLYRIVRNRQRKPRVTWPPVAHWPAYLPTQPPAPSANDNDKLDWAVNSAIVELHENFKKQGGTDLASVLLAIKRERLATSRMRVYDSLLGDLMDRTERRTELRTRLSQIPPGALTPSLKRRLETSRMVDLHQALSKGDIVRAGQVWDELLRSDSSFELKIFVTARVAALADRPSRLRNWRAQLRATLQSIRATNAAALVDQELKRVEEKLGL